MKGRIAAKGIKWNANHIKRVPAGRPGVFVIYDEKSKTAKIRQSENIMMGLREEWWKKNFWYFSWFETSPPEYRFELLEELEGKSYDDLWELT